MDNHGIHLVLYAVAYGVSLNLIASFCMRLTFRDAFRALDQKQRHVLSLWSTVLIFYIAFSLPLFIIGMRFVRSL